MFKRPQLKTKPFKGTVHAVGHAGLISTTEDQPASGISQVSFPGGLAILGRWGV